MPSQWKVVGHDEWNRWILSLNLPRPSSFNPYEADLKRHRTDSAEWALSFSNMMAYRMSDPEWQAAQRGRKLGESHIKQTLRLRDEDRFGFRERHEKPIRESFLGGRLDADEEAARNHEALQRDGALSHAPLEKRFEAVRSLRDESVLAEIAIKSPDMLICQSAVGRIGDKWQLMRVARCSPIQAVRAQATELVHDEGVLKCLGLDASQIDVRVAAVGRISDQQYLFDRVADQKDADEVRDVAFDQLHDDRLLAQVYIQGFSIYDDYEKFVRNFREKAFNRITDEDALCSIAISPLCFGEDWRVALDKLRRRDLLRRVMQMAQFDPERKARALARLKELFG
jgi:hypothetical protein